MRRPSATTAIATARLGRLQLPIFFTVSVAASLAGLQFHAGVSEQLAGATLFGCAAGIFLALLQRGSHVRDLELCEQSAPLYGREIARAIALVPGIGVSCTIAAYWAVAIFSPGTHWLAIIGSLTSANAVSAVALCATLRSGWSRWLYLAITGGIAALLTVILVTQLPTALLLSGIAGFAALRQYGEALARWDPIESLANLRLA